MIAYKLNIPTAFVEDYFNKMKTIWMIEGWPSIEELPESLLKEAMEYVEIKVSELWKNDKMENIDDSKPWAGKH